MAQEYFSAKKTATMEEPRSPALTDADEEFLKRITSSVENEPSQEVVIFDHQPDPETSGLEDAEKAPLPTSPPAGTTKEEKGTQNKLQSMFTTIRSSVPISFGKKQQRADAADHVQAIATSIKTGDSLVEVPREEAEKEKADMTSILDRLNLAAVNNKAFSFSQESQRLMQEFTQILKDIVNGVPTAYDDLEKLLSQRDKQLREMFDNMPPFLQNLVKSLPSKMTASIAPGLLAAASEKPGADAKMMAESSGQKKKSRKTKVPLLKNLIKTDSVVAMLKSILNFLKLRFPTFIGGTNVLLSLAVFLLLFVFWYCHKRGKETRLEKERLSAEEASDFESSSELEGSITDDAPSQSTADARKLETALHHGAPASMPLPETPNGK